MSFNSFKYYLLPENKLKNVNQPSITFNCMVDATLFNKVTSIGGGGGSRTYGIFIEHWRDFLFFLDAIISTQQ